ncbi:MAG TPA: radical SAM protein [Xanthobacteraceae bacterium]|nr:radical SAM protein [Xanthobacteraceae bacterium]
MANSESSVASAEDLEGALAKRAFRVVLIKPSHYDDDGYVIQWLRSTLPSNSLASVYGLIEECARDQVLGPDVDIEIEACDECNTVVNVASIAKRIRKAGGGMVGLIGVQSNQYPRALDLGRQFRNRGLAVVIGGFHVSGCISMLPSLPADLQEALDLGIHLYAGEAEGRMAELLRDVAAGNGKPIYRYLNDLPEMGAAVFPILPRKVVTRVANHYSSFDAGRGCPFQCSFCTIINVQGRKSRYRTADDVEAIVRANAANGITRFFVTDDNFARNRNWEPILDRLIALREDEEINIRLMLQVDTLCHRIPNFIEKAARAGCSTAFIGLENINPESLMGTKKRQNKIWEYREMLLAWRRNKVMTYAGYILGFPTDTPESIARDIDIIKKELPIDILEFFFLTPLPGSEDHKNLFTRGVPMDPDMNKYDLEHACTAHPRMSKQDWEKVYSDAWARYYTDAHVETILRRAVATDMRRTRIREMLTVFSGAVRIEGVHPLQFGYVRRKVRTQRRHGLPLVHPLIFYPQRTIEVVKTLSQWLALAWRYNRILKKVATDPATANYTDDALRPHTEAADADHLVEVFADKIPQTHGAPVRAAAAVA